mgnify:FL=1
MKIKCPIHLRISTPNSHQTLKRVSLVLSLCSEYSCSWCSQCKQGFNSHQKPDLQSNFSNLFLGHILSKLEMFIKMNIGASQMPVRGRRKRPQNRALVLSDPCEFCLGVGRRRTPHKILELNERLCKSYTFMPTGHCRVK